MFKDINAYTIMQENLSDASFQALQNMLTRVSLLPFYQFVVYSKDNNFSHYQENDHIQLLLQREDVHTYLHHATDHHLLHIEGHFLPDITILMQIFNQEDFDLQTIHLNTKIKALTQENIDTNTRRNNRRGLEAIYNIFGESKNELLNQSYGNTELEIPYYDPYNKHMELTYLTEEINPEIEQWLTERNFIFKEELPVYKDKSEEHMFIKRWLKKHIYFYISYGNTQTELICNKAIFDDMLQQLTDLGIDKENYKLRIYYDHVPQKFLNGVNVIQQDHLSRALETKNYNIYNRCKRH